MGPLPKVTHLLPLNPETRGQLRVGFCYLSSYSGPRECAVTKFTPYTVPTHACRRSHSPGASGLGLASSATQGAIFCGSGTVVTLVTVFLEFLVRDAHRLKARVRSSRHFPALLLYRRAQVHHL